MQKPLRFPIISVLYLEPNKPLDLGVLQSRVGELSWLSLRGGSSDLTSLGPQRTSLGRLFHAIVCALSNGQRPLLAEWLVQRYMEHKFCSDLGLEQIYALKIYL